MSSRLMLKWVVYDGEVSILAPAKQAPAAGEMVQQAEYFAPTATQVMMNLVILNWQKSTPTCLLMVWSDA